MSSVGGNALQVTQVTFIPFIDDSALCEHDLTNVNVY